MHCPRCGTPNEPGDRYCAACGAQLKRSDASGEQKVAGNRLAKLLGRDRKTRLVTGATIAALAVAVAAFIALSPSDDSIPRDHYTLAAERICLNSKQHIVGAEGIGGGAYARQLVVIIVSWREQMADLQVPEDRQEKARQLDQALREVEIEVAALARIIESGNRARTLASVKRAEAATAGVEQAIADLGLTKCAQARIGVPPAP